jgi:hypothetical protein
MRVIDQFRNFINATEPLVIPNPTTFTGAVIFSGVSAVGAFSSATAGSGIAINSAKTKAFDILADDGGVALTAGSYQAARFRMLVATTIASGNISIAGALGHLKVVANVASSAPISGIRGYIECSGAAISSASAVRGMIDIPSGCTISSGAIASAFMADSLDLGGTHTGSAAVIHVANPGAGTWDFFAAFGTATGCTLATFTGNSAFVPNSKGTFTQCGQVKILINATTYYIPYGTVA